MLSYRVIPFLLLDRSGLVKTTKFSNPVYLGDPRNTVKIFNDKEVDELILLDIRATPKQRPIQFDLIREIVSEAFMPVGYGGGISTIEQAKQLLNLGVEKVVINTAAFEQPQLISELARELGSQSVVVSIDAKRGLLGKYEVYINGGTRRTKQDPAFYARRIEALGAGEIVINSIDRDGTMSGYDMDLIQQVTEAVHVPVVACGGAGKMDHFREAIFEGGASAAGAGSMFVFHGRHRAVLINYPDQASLRLVLKKQ